jgi:hypothetical protein
VAAAHFITALQQGKRIINIDESVLHFTDHRRRGWLPAGKHNQVTTSKKVTGINLIAALCSTGEVMYTVNLGLTNSVTFGFFLSKLSLHMDGVDPKWREHSVIMLDNAPYHRSAAVRKTMSELKLPMLYLGPYDFHLAPIEMAFCFIKGHDLPTQLMGVNGR